MDMGWKGKREVRRTSARCCYHSAISADFMVDAHHAMGDRDSGWALVHSALSRLTSLVVHAP